MSKTKRPMIDPNPVVLGSQLTADELAFLEENRSDKAVSADAPADKKNAKKSKKAKPRTLSMSDDFFDALSNFVETYPEEGSRSALIVRVVTDYMNRKNQNIRNS